ncbi:MAG: sugar transporter substrate-binding protein [Chloroflexi bacterium]|nr:sugar transporter substrate-binding protein [Chloroflexota bacterium]
MKQLRASHKVAATGLIVGLLAGTAPALSHVPAAAASKQSAATGSVGFLMSDYTTSARWVFDRDFYKAALAKTDPAVTVNVSDAKNNQTTQQNNAQSALTQGVKVLVDVPVDSAGAGQIVRLAHANKPYVPVISYDRLITGAPVDAYVSFDGFSVGVQQATYLKSKVAKGGTIVLIGGAPTDNNAHLFYNGALSVLGPLFKSGYYKKGYDKFTTGWNPALGQSEMAAALTQLNNKVDGVLSANDGLAGGIIAALKAQHLSGKVPVTGQDATVAGLQQVLLGNQSMTIYKPIRKLAAATAQVTDVLLSGKKFTSKVTVANGAGNVPSVLLPVVTVTKANIKSTVIADGYVTKADLCKGIPASACKGL